MTTSNRLLITEMAATQTDRSVTVNEMIAKLEAGACVFGCESVGDNAPPGGPAEGDIYIVGTAGTGAFSGHNEQVAIYYNAAWMFLPALPGMLAYAADEDAYYYFNATDWISAGFGGGSAASPYDVPLSFAGTPDADELMGKLIVPRDVEFQANFSGSSGHVGTVPDATFDIDVQDDGASIGTISISTGGTFTFTTAGGTAKTVVAGSRIEFYAPSASPAEASIAAIAATLKGTT